MKNLWTTVHVPVSVLKDAETIKDHEKTIEGYEKTLKAQKLVIKILKEENDYLKSSTGESGAGFFPPAELMKTTAEKKRDKDLGAVRSVLERRIREKITESALKGEMSTIIYVDELADLYKDAVTTGGYSRQDIIEPVIKALREEDYWVDEVTTSIGGCFRWGYQVSWG